MLSPRMSRGFLLLTLLFSVAYAACTGSPASDHSKDGYGQDWVSDGEVTIKAPATKKENYLLRLQHARGALVPFAATPPRVATAFSQWTHPADPSKGHTLIRMDSPMFIENSRLNRFGEQFAFTASPDVNARIAPIAQVTVRRCPAYTVNPVSGRLVHTAFVQGPTQLYNRERDYDWISTNGQLMAVASHCTLPFDPSTLIGWGASHDLNRTFRLLGREDRPITFGWELESSNTDIVNYYKFPGYLDEQWLRMNYDERAQILRDELKRTSEYIVDYQTIKTTPFVKMSHAPSYWSTELTAENAYVWEIFSAEPVNTFAELVAQMQSIRIYNGNSHIHMAFQAPVLNDETTIVRFKTLFILANMYVLLRSYGDTLSTYGGRRAAFLNNNLRPLDPFDIKSLDEMLRTESGKARLDLKWHMVGYRVLIPYPVPLHGIELRGLGKNVEEQLELTWRLVNALEDLGRPVRLHTAAPMEDGYMLDDQVQTAVALLDEVSIAKCVGIVDAARCKYARRRELVQEALFSSMVGTQRVDLPYQNWEFVPALSTATDSILSAREKYEQDTIYAIRNTDMNKGHELLAYRSMDALIAWATATRLWEQL